MSLDLMRARVTFRERSFADVLDLSLRFVAVNAWLYTKVALVLLPLVALTLGVATLFGWWAAWPTAFVLGFVTDVPFTMLASRLVFEDDVRAREVLLASLREVPRVLLMRLVWCLGLVLALVLFFFPALWGMTVLGFTNEAMLLERTPIFQAFRRSNRLATNALPDAILAGAFMLLAPLAAILLAEIGGREVLGDLLQFQPPSSMFTEGGSALAVLGWFLFIPYAVTARFFVYLNVRTRVEGWDVQTRFAALAMRAEAA